MGELTKPTTKDELIELFVECVNCAEPEHPYKSDPYPITVEDVDVGWCRSDGPYWAKCGPRNGLYTASFSPATDELLSMKFSKLLAIITHEIAHITEGSHSDGSVHNKAFWRQMAFMAWQIREGSSYVGDDGLVSDEEYVTEVIEEPNTFTVDKRIETVAERKQEMRELLGRE